MYLAETPSLLVTTLDGIQNLAQNMRNLLPAAEGILIQPISLCERARRIKQKYYKQAQRASIFHSLETSHRPGRKRQDSRFRGRVGRKADRLRKVIIYIHMGFGYAYCIHLVLHGMFFNRVQLWTKVLKSGSTLHLRSINLNLCQVCIKAF